MIEVAHISIGEMVSEDSDRRDASDATCRSGLALLLSSVVWMFLGTALFFALYALLASGRSPTGTLISALISGGVGVFVGTLWLRKFTGYRIFVFFVLAAYILRVLIGVILYLHVLDPGYFDGKGIYKNKNWEYSWTYVNVMIVADSVINKGEWRTSRILSPEDDKNAYIHTWMGYFMAAGGSRHALDLAPFNAFHHVVAGTLIVGVALACGYPLLVSLWSGALTAWLPWAFASSIMWRDSVGLAWVVLAIALLCIGRELGLLGSLLLAIPAAFLAWADRAPYFFAVVVITVMSISYDQQKMVAKKWARVPRLIIVSMLLVLVLSILWNNIASFAFETHSKIATVTNILSRIVLIPLLVLRALAGPFPWFVGGKFDMYVLCDYFFHVFQFAIFLIFAVKWRSILSRVNIMTYSAAIFWVMAFITGGIHTAYLAVAAPFILPPVLNTGSKLWIFMLISAGAFLLGNVAYVAFGLVGSGLILDITGY